MRDVGHIVAALLAAVGLSLATDPVPELAFVLQGTGLGALVGAVVAYRRGLEGRQATGMVVRWTLLIGGAFGAYAGGDALIAAVRS